MKLNYILLCFLFLLVAGCTVDNQLGTSLQTKIETDKDVTIAQNNNQTNLQIEQIKATTVSQLAIITATIVANSNQTNLLINENNNNTKIILSNKFNGLIIDIVFYFIVGIGIIFGLFYYFSSKKQIINVLPNVKYLPRDNNKIIVIKKEINSYEN